MKFLKKNKFIIFIFFYPIVFFIEKIKFLYFIKLIEFNTDRLGHVLRYTEGFLIAKNIYKYEELNNCKIIIFFFGPVANQQTKKMIQRVLPVHSFYLLCLFFMILKEALIYWKKESHIIDLNKYVLKNLLLSHDSLSLFQKYTKPYLSFTGEEDNNALLFLKKLGISKKDKWICVHARDSFYLDSKFPTYDWQYHNYRDFNVNSLVGAAEYFANEGYFVFRMGSLQKDNLKTTNPKIIDYANSEFRNDFLDIYLLANCKFYFGGDSGPSDVAYTFFKPAYGVNFSGSTILESRSHLSYLFIFKRIKNIKNNKLLSLKDIFESDYSSNFKANIIDKEKFLLIDNSSEEIKLLALEVEKEINGKQIENKQDKVNQEEFWNIYMKYINLDYVNKNAEALGLWNAKKRLGTARPKISPTFLRNNLDLLN